MSTRLKLRCRLFPGTALVFRWTMVDRLTFQFLLFLNWLRLGLVFGPKLGTGMIGMIGMIGFFFFRVETVCNRSCPLPSNPGGQSGKVSRTSCSGWQSHWRGSWEVSLKSALSGNVRNYFPILEGFSANEVSWWLNCAELFCLYHFFGQKLTECRNRHVRIFPCLRSASYF